ncbi:hypothetical protein TIFTF001_027347 [Ficus carica]|uniref:Uncharacterized protein n=1 Tax=Ficus carica TaxID=3494 RepID=A0AA88IYB8_FICCA|nr:hypothetical protein TIFTF001_027347 [Ficus carica]
MNKIKKFSSSSKSNNSHKGKAATNTFDFKMKGNGIQCHECEDFRHIQSECASTLRKRVNHSIPLGVMRNWKAAKRRMIVSNHVALTIFTDGSSMEIFDVAVSASVATSAETSSSVATPPGTPNETSIEMNGLNYSDSECLSVEMKKSVMMTLSRPIKRCTSSGSNCVN